MVRNSSHLDLSGPFFTNDPTKTFRANVRVLMKRIAEEAEADVKQQIPHRSGATAAGIKGRTENWQVTAVVSQTRIFPWDVHRHGSPNAQYRGGKLERKIHMFRKTTARMRRAKAINQVELLKGLK